MSEIDELVIFLNEREKQDKIKILLMQEWYDTSRMKNIRIECNLADFLRSFQSWQEERHYGDRR